MFGSLCLTWCPLLVVLAVVPDAIWKCSCHVRGYSFCCSYASLSCTVSCLLCTPRTCVCLCATSCTSRLVDALSWIPAIPYSVQSIETPHHASILPSPTMRPDIPQSLTQSLRRVQPLSSQFQTTAPQSCYTSVPKLPAFCPKVAKHPIRT